MSAILVSVGGGGGGGGADDDGGADDGGGSDVVGVPLHPASIASSRHVMHRIARIFFFIFVSSIKFYWFYCLTLLLLINVGLQIATTYKLN
jgi:hypothetical protein